MNLSNGLPSDPLSATQFNMPAMVRYKIDQMFNRIDGEQMPVISGEYLRVESVDMPARIAFNNQDINQSIPLTAGMSIDGNFSGVTIFHDDYSNFTVGLPFIVLNVGRDNKLQVDNSDAVNNLALNYKAFATTTTLGTSVIPVPSGHKKMDVNFSVICTNLAQPVTGVLNWRFLDKNNIAVVAGSFTRDGNIYNTISADALTLLIDGKNTGANEYTFQSSAKLRIPSGAVVLQALFSLGTAVTSIGLAKIAAYAG